MRKFEKSYTRELLRDLGKFVDDKFNRLFFYFAFGVNVGGWIVSYYIIKHTERESVYLHYNVDFGVDYIGLAKRVFDFPLIGLVVIIVNILVSLLITHRDRFITQMLLFVSLVVNVFLSRSMTSTFR